MIRLGLRVRRERAELVLAELLELAPNGVEEADAGELVEFAVYGAPGELPELPALRAAAGDALCEVVTERLPEDWFDGWKRFHPPVLIGDRLRVRPPWEPAATAGDRVDLVIDPGQAFGTGSHDTTRACLELMLSLAPAGSFADIGCGSGVLAITAATLGWGPVLALDHEPAAVRAARANAQANRVEVEVRRFDLRREPPPATGTIAANLLRPLLLELAAAMEQPPRHLVAGGLLRDQADEVAGAFRDAGLRETRRHEAGEWATLLLEGG
ncbi:MAG: 50S ribosomal protein L11 methyltransferase [Solirubrobacteraceae bacterium]